MGEAEDKSKVQEVLEEYADIFPAERTDKLSPMRSHKLSVKLTNDPEPRRSRIYRLSKWQLDELESPLATVTRKGLIQPSALPCGSPISFAAKKDGGLRMCINYRALNKATI